MQKHIALPLLAAALVLAGRTPTLCAPAQAAPPQAAALTRVLQSGAPLKEKMDACRQLAVVGTRDSVPALAALLGDEQLSHMARYALQGIPDPAVDAAFRDAMATLQGRPLVGVIQSIGVRGDTRAVKALTRKLEDADPDVAQAAARALGTIGSPAAAKALLAALPKTSVANRLAVCEGLFRAAESLSRLNKPKVVRAIYDQLRKLDGPHQVRAGALRGAILLRGKDGLPILRESLRGPDNVLAAAAARTALELPGSDVVPALAAELDQLSADRQILVIQVLGRRGDPAALPALASATRNRPNPVRLAALRALPEIGDPSVVPVLVNLLLDTDTEVASVAQESLAALPGPSVDAAATKMLESDNAALRLTGLDLIGRRRITTCMPALFQATEDPDAKVRSAAFKRLNELGSPAEAAALLERLLAAKEKSDIADAAQALASACGRAKHPEAQAEQVVRALPEAQPAQKVALLGVLGSLGGLNSAQTVRASLNDADPEIRTAALRALANWKTPDVAPDLFKLAQSTSNPSERLLCLRAYLGWAANSELPASRRLDLCREAAPVLQQPEEKKLLLAALGNLKSLEGLELIAPHLDSAATREEAAAATVATADELLKGDQAATAAPKLVAPLQKATTAANADLANRAKELLAQAQQKAGPQ